MTDASLAGASRVDRELLRRFDRSGPRYTSYPTAVEFHQGVGEADYLRRLAGIADAADAANAANAASLYVHIPFCERLCGFCACHFIATPHRHVAATYLDYLDREVALLTERLPGRPRLRQMQWGGGTPTYLGPSELERLFTSIAGRFGFELGAELAIEVDPRVTSREQLATLRRLGFNRLSMGVQDFTPSVQEAIGRHQTFQETRALVDSARELGFTEGINFDLIYGLPRQDEASFESNLDRLLELRPDRVALYSFAYVPWARPHQQRIAAATLPTSEVKVGLYLSAFDRLVGAGYEPVGIDHFALPEDELARAARESRLDRNFMGYSPTPVPSTFALGVSGIGELDGAFFQNHRKLSRYYEALDTGRLPIERGHLLDDDDRLRQDVIRRFMCGFAVDRSAVEARFGIDFDRYFAAPLAQLLAPQGPADGPPLLVEQGRILRVSDAGRFFVRNVCMAFDRYLEARQATGKPAYSRTI